MNVAASIASFGTTYSVTRTAAGSNATGVYTPGSASTLSITASVQPITGEDVKRLPEGVSTEGLIKLWTTTALKTPRDVSGSSGGDTISFSGRTYMVESVSDWNTVGGYYEAVLRQVKA